MRGFSQNWLMSPLTDPDRINQQPIRSDPGRPAVLCGRSQGSIAARAGYAARPVGLALGHGGPRDLGAIQAGLRAAASISMLMASGNPPFAGARRGARGDRRLAVVRSRPPRCDACRYELPSSSVAALREGANADLDEVQGLRDQSRRVLAGLQLQYSQIPASSR